MEHWYLFRPPKSHTNRSIAITHVVPASESVKEGDRQLLDFTWLLAAKAKLKRALTRIRLVNPD